MCPEKRNTETNSGDFISIKNAYDDMSTNSKNVYSRALSCPILSLPKEQGSRSLQGHQIHFPGYFIFPKDQHQFSTKGPDVKSKSRCGGGGADVANLNKESPLINKMFY